MRHETLLLCSRLTTEHLDLKIAFWREPLPNEHIVLDYLSMFERHDRTHREQLRAAMRWVRMGEGNVDIEGYLRKYVELCPGKAVSMEIIGGTRRGSGYWTRPMGDSCS